MKVIQTIQSIEEGATGPHEITFYSGDSLAQAMAALANCASDMERPERFYRVLAVRLEA